MRAAAFVIEALIAALLAVPRTSVADEPLRPPERVETLVTYGSVVADPDLGTTDVRIGDRPDWTVPGWHAFWSVSTGDDYFLAVQAGGNLIGPLDPQIVAVRGDPSRRPTRHRRPAAHGQPPCPLRRDRLGRRRIGLAHPAAQRPAHPAATRRLTCGPTTAETG